MSTIVFAGAAQLVAMEIWSNAPTLAVIGSLALVTAAVNMRFLLMSAALRPWFGGLPAWQAYPMLFFATDPGWLMSMRYRAEGVSDVGLFVGTGMVVWVTWAGATVPGYLLGALAADPRRFGLDAIMPALFTALLVPLWRGPRNALPWLVAGGVALAVAKLVPGWWFIMAGALAGSIAGGFLDERD